MAAAIAALLATACGKGNDDDGSQPRVQGMQFGQERYEVRPGKVVRPELRITIDGSESDFDYATNLYQVEFSIDDPAVAQVRADGLVTGVGYGSTRLTARSVYSETPAVTSVYVVPAGLRLDRESYVLSLNEKVRPQLILTEISGERPTDNRFGIVWKIDDPAVATVAADGTLTAVGYGTATLTGTSELTPPLSATVAVQVQGLRFESPQYLFDGVGDKQRPRLLVTENDVEVEADNDRLRIEWSIENQTVALLNGYEVTAAAPGATVLKATTPFYPEAVTAQIIVSADWTGEWMLSLWNGSDELSGKVYMALEADGGFALYQNIDRLGYQVFRGTYTVAAENGKMVLSGVYDDNVAWASKYELAREGDTLNLTSLSDGVVSQYVLTEIPDYVKDGVTGAPAYEARRSAGKRFL